ncbi:MAG: hypothetical protein Q4G34_05425, partial [Micrococcus sp.]|nr:hypothetical protein [Micrococcus sp.]
LFDVYDATLRFTTNREEPVNDLFFAHEVIRGKWVKKAADAFVVSAINSSSCFRSRSLID